MLETFTWTDKPVLKAEHVTVVACINPAWDVMADLNELPGAIFGFVLDGDNATLRREGWVFELRAGSYFVANAGQAMLSSPGGRILLIHQPGADFPFMVGGPIEDKGRLRYIDGCTDSLLIPPWRKGEACLNLLHIPPGVEQTEHTHPSDRIGVVVSGSGQCETPVGTVDLLPGMIWRIPADGLHRFLTRKDSLRIVAWHPDSDTGPSDEDHPMIRRTIVDGVSAAQIDAIRTR